MEEEYFFFFSLFFFGGAGGGGDGGLISWLLFWRTRRITFDFDFFKIILLYMYECSYNDTIKSVI